MKGASYLLANHYRASWEEVVRRFGTNGHRYKLLGGLKAALTNLKGAGCKHVYLDGSFITSKEEPADWDGCWELELKKGIVVIDLETLP